ncbi:F-box protein At5g39450 [Magnolia sinica]|uniref:F-box protein At5g39450 n=1 Tax=Magnolia sinica TaxID=86752 RepID=UPI0026594443|nr:F-box protein At5g39450 [Magnolia sinica]
MLSGASLESTDPCGSHLFLSLPDDVLAIISRSLHPRDTCNLSLCCRAFQSLAHSDKIWHVQCSRLQLLPPRELTEWRVAFPSYKSICLFLLRIQPLLGLWVHQNPELGNVVYIMPGFASVVACRVIPQELGPSGIDGSPLLWAPVFEIVALPDGSPAFFLHGRERDSDYFYPGLLRSVESNCNVLLLEVEPRGSSGGKLSHTKSMARHCDSDAEPSRAIGRSNSSLSRSSRMAATAAASASAVVPFSRLAFGDRRKMLELVANQVGLKVPDSLSRSPLFVRSGEEVAKEMVLLLERRSLLVQMYKVGEGRVNWWGMPGLWSDGRQMDSGKTTKKILDRSGTWHSLTVNWDEGAPLQTGKRRSVAGYFKDGLKQMLGRSNSANGNSSMLFLKNGSPSTSERKHAPLQEFLRASDTIGLSLVASKVKLSSYRAWPNMHDNRYALYKLPLQVPGPDHEYAGLWGGSFGWPPGRPTEDKPAKALFFVLISYDETEGQRMLIATKILEGTHYVLHPNGSAMFIVKVDEPSSDPFPWDVDGDSVRVEIKQAYHGEGIANGYGFRYPGSKPGALFVTQNGLLAFVWNETKAVLTLQRLNLQNLLKRGERVPALSAIFNFSYLTKSHSNVFVGSASASHCLPSPRNFH